MLDALRPVVGAMVRHALWFSPMPVLVLAAGAVLYFAWSRASWQNLVLIVLGCVCAWYRSPLFFAVMSASAVLEWLIARAVAGTSNQRHRTVLVWFSALSNLLVLTLVHSYSLLPPLVADSPSWSHLVDEFLAAAPSFWVFSKITLTLDAYGGRLASPPRFLPSMAYMTLFARFNSAGIPIDRARDTMPQLEEPRRWSWSRAEDSVWVALQGLIKLTVSYCILSPFFSALEGATGFGMYARCWSFAFNAWYLLSGGIDIAVASAWFFGIGIRPNFDAPFFSRNIGEFWQRWSISVGAWLNEEVFSRLSFAWRGFGDAGIIAACFATFIGCGLAHAANWANVTWGLILGGAMAVYLVSRKPLRKLSKSLGNPAWLSVIAWFLTINVFIMAMIPDGEDSMDTVFHAFAAMFRSSHVGVAASATQWGLSLTACLGGLVFQFLHHRLGGDFWMRSLRPLPRMVVGGCLILLGLAVSALPWV